MPPGAEGIPPGAGGVPPGAEGVPSGAEGVGGWVGGGRDQGPTVKNQVALSPGRVGA